jgi:murein DD-endopeptidase MepM/ murein hydrolase activator NlpD
MRQFLVCLLAATLVRALPAEAGLPAITRLDPNDTLFRQYQADVEYARRHLYNQQTQQRASPKEGASVPAEQLAGLTVYTYTPGPGEDLLALAARCNIPYAALATLNRLANPAGMAQAGVLLLPSVPGLFIPERADTDMERLLQAARGQEPGVRVTIRQPHKTEQFHFIPGADFSPTERSFFLNRGFYFPLKNYRLTSGFGPRISPITGTLKFHPGLDLAAPLGTEIYAVREGVVVDQGRNAVYGNYIIIRHEDNWASLYGHLQQIHTSLHMRVQSGSVIGRVGSTGLSTGPHLHFELRQFGKAQDPSKYLLNPP